MRGIGRRVQQAGSACQAARRRYRIFASGAHNGFTQRDFDGKRIKALAHEILKHGAETCHAIIRFAGLFVAMLIIIVGHEPYFATPRRERSTIFPAPFSHRPNPFEPDPPTPAVPHAKRNNLSRGTSTVLGGFKRGREPSFAPKAPLQAPIRETTATPHVFPRLPCIFATDTFLRIRDHITETTSCKSVSAMLLQCENSSMGRRYSLPHPAEDGLIV